MTIDIGQGLLNALMYMGPVAIVGGLVCMYLWERTCRTKIKVILVKSAGGAATSYAPKEGDAITLHNPSLGVTRVWPISRLTTIPQPYPDLAGILPKFLCREIQTAFLVEGDWEPLLNRSPHREKIASPDVVKFLLGFVVKYPDAADTINQFLDGVSTGPTRELVGDSAWIGALKASTALRALASVSDDLLEALKGIRDQLARFSGLNSTYIYLGLGLIVVLQAFILYYILQGSGQADIAAMNAKLDIMSKALGIK